MSIHQYPGKSGTTGTAGVAAGQFVAAADDEGTLHILEVPRQLYKAGKNEVRIGLEPSEFLLNFFSYHAREWQ